MENLRYYMTVKLQLKAEPKNGTYVPKLVVLDS
jgi:hypothetical protein